MEGENIISSFPPKQIKIFQCQSCYKYQVGSSTSPNWIPIIFGSPDFIQYCLSYLQCPQDIRISGAHIIQSNNSLYLNFDLSIEFVSIENQRKQAIIHFTIEQIVCNCCRESLSSVQEQQWSCTVIISTFADRMRPLHWLEQKIEQSSRNSNLSNNQDNDISMILFDARSCASMMAKEDGKIIFKFDNKRLAFRLISFIQREIAVKIEEKIEKIPKQTSFNPEFVLDYDLHVTYSIILPGIWPDDLVCLPESFCNLKDSSCLCICTKASDSIIFTDPETGISTEVTPKMYWDDPFPALLMKSSMVLFEILSISLIGPRCGRNQMCDLEIVLDSNNLTEKSDIINNRNNGNNNKITDKSKSDLNFNPIFLKSFLGNQLKPGDFCLGYDLRNGINPPPGSGPLHSQPEAIIVSKVDSSQNINQQYFVDEFIKDGFDVSMIKEQLLVNKVPSPEQSDSQNKGSPQNSLSTQFSKLNV